MVYQGCPVSRSILSADGLARYVLVKYSLTEPLRCNFFNRGVNDTYLVRAGSERYYLRVYAHDWRKESEIEAELAMLLILHQEELPVSYPLARNDGRYVTRIAAPEGTRYACLFSDAKGQLARMDRASSRAYGELVGKIHDCLDKTPDDDRRFHLDMTHLVEEPLAYLESFLGANSKAYRYFETIGLKLGRRVEDLLPKTKPIYGNCHGDHHGANLHIDESGALALFDFDCYGYGWRAYDLAVFLWSQSNFLNSDEADRLAAEELWDCFLEGYAVTRTLSAEELEATRIFVPIRYLWKLGNTARDVEKWGHIGFGAGQVRQCIKAIGQCIRNFEILD